MRKMHDGTQSYKYYHGATVSHEKVPSHGHKTKRLVKGLKRCMGALYIDSILYHSILCILFDMPFYSYCPQGGCYCVLLL